MLEKLANKTQKFKITKASQTREKNNKRICLNAGVRKRQLKAEEKIYGRMKE